MILFASSIFLITDVRSQGNVNGTCCPTTSGAICFTYIYQVPDHYYLAEGDCLINTNQF